VFYYITVMNENYVHPAMPEGAEDGILKGMYLLPRGRIGRGRACSCSAAAPSCAK
jgi:pyruvate dehydrogenase E1 component